MRLAWLLFLFPSVAFAIAGCPVGVQLGNVTVATNLPICLKFESSQLGGCIVECKGVCVEFPLANKKGPVETTGAACDWTQNASGNGDSDGSGNTPAEGGSSGNGGLPKNWDFFNPVLGDATGTSVSATIAKLNKNLGQHIGAFSENSDKIYQRVNELTGDSRRIVNASEAAQQYLKEISEYNRVAGYKRDGFELYLSRMEPLLKEISINTANTGSASGGVPSSVASDVAGISSMMGASLNMMSSIQGNTNGLNNKLDDISGNTKATSYFAKDMKDSLKNIERSLGGGSGSGSGSDGGSSAWTSSDVASLVESSSTTANQSEQQTYVLQDMRTALEIMAEKLGNGGNGNGNGNGDGSGSSIDYSKLPGSSDNPLSVKEAKYSSYCSGENCFFDIAATQKTLDDAKKSLSDKQSDISKEVQDMFAFQLSGSAGAIDCFDLFSHNGKNYRVCPPSKEYWATLAAMMMFIFYFIALLVIFRR
ncbi:hypothetical protein AADX40_15805 [Aeromonas veronii]|uniref:hypothetical protein n=1 Tax=Aeromonas veronii TaxID=654 RepID=UPI0031585706